MVIAIAATILLAWSDYLLLAAVGFGLPLLSSFWSPLSSIELLHFHSTNFVTFFVIGLTVRANFRYQDEVANLTKNLIQSSKMIALGEMSSGISHEVNNPLAIITICSSQVESFLKDVEKNRGAILQTLQKINQSAFRIAKIIKSLHDFSQSNSQEKFENVDMVQLAREALQHKTDQFLAKGVLVEFVSALEAVQCFCQANQVAQILSNLLINAFEACQDSPQPKIKVTLSQKNKLLHISVIDNGPGVPTEIENKIMQPFFTTKPTGKGAGLGLSMALGIAQSNHGELFLDRQISNSCFTLSLPLVQG